MFDNLHDYLHEKLEELDRQIVADGALSAADLQCGDIWAHFAKNLATYVAMEDRGEYSNRGIYYDGGTSMRDGRRGNTYRNEPSRRSRRGYSGADRMDDVVQAVNDAMGDMPDDIRREAQRFLSRMQQY